LSSHDEKNRQDWHLPGQPKPPIPPLLGVGLGILVVSTSSIVTRYAQAYAPSLVIAAWRLSLASVVLAPIVVGRERQALRRLTRQEIGLGLASGCLLALHFATWIASLEYTTVASSVVLVSTMPLFVAILGRFTLGESISRPIALGIMLGFVGAVAIALADACAWQTGLRCPPLGSFVSGTAFLGDALAVAGALAGGGYLLIGRRLRKGLPLTVYIGISYGAAAVVLITMMLLARQSPFGFPPSAYLLFAFLALGPQLLGHSSLNWALRYLSAAVVALTLLGETVGSTILAFLLLHEQPSALKLVAIGLILAGIYVASRGQSSQPTPHPEGAAV
jgi:drug/metabolite transporter (DMT)-like permease